jgi:transposase InsO family protein
LSGTAWHQPTAGSRRRQAAKFDRYPIGFFRIDLAEVRTAESKLYLLVPINRTSKFVAVEFVEKAGMQAAAAFLQALVEAVPYRIHTVLTDNGIQFADLAKNRKGPTARFRGHPLHRVCLLNGIEHRLTKPNHPWTNGQVERMNRTIKEATVQRYHYDSHNQLRTHLSDFVAAYNFAKRLKTLRGLTVYEFICKCWQIEPDRFTLDPTHQLPRLYS